MPVDYNMEARVAYLRWLASEDAAEAEFTRDVRDYASGQHPTYLTDRQKEFLGLKAKDTSHLYAHNLCQMVIEAVVERLHVEGFELAALGGSSEVVEAEEEVVPLLEYIQRWCVLNRFDTLQDEVHEAALRDGEAYVVVDWDGINGRPRWTVNLKTDGTQGIQVYRDPSTNKVLFVAKTWQVNDPLDDEDNGRTRKTLYFEDRVEKYISTVSGAGVGGTGWEAFVDEGDAGWPIPCLDASGEALGIPVIEFANPGGAEITQAIPIQDMLNKTDLDLVAALDTGGFRILYAAGVEPTIDSSTGAEAALTISPGKLIRFGSPEARLGAVEPTDVVRMIAACKYWIESVASITRTPHYLFQASGAEPPSGESLRQQEVGLVHKVERRGRVFGNAWEDAMAVSVKLHNLYQPVEAVEWQPIETVWASAEEFIDELGSQEREASIRKVNAEAGVLEQQQGVSQDTLLRRLGLDPEEERMQREAGGVQLGEQLLTAFDRGE